MPSLRSRVEVLEQRLNASRAGELLDLVLLAISDQKAREELRALEASGKVRGHPYDLIDSLREAWEPASVDAAESEGGLEEAPRHGPERETSAVRGAE